MTKTGREITNLLALTNPSLSEDSRVVWVPVMERRPEMTAAIGDALKSETEKTQRISKMLNVGFFEFKTNVFKFC